MVVVYGAFVRENEGSMIFCRHLSNNKIAISFLKQPLYSDVNNVQIQICNETIHWKKQHFFYNQSTVK
jgi:hypothetical protein